LVPATVATMLLGYQYLATRWQTAVVSLMLATGVLGIAQLTVRDAVSLNAYPDSFTNTQSVIASLLTKKSNIVTAPGFVVFTNPELTSVAGKELTLRKRDDWSRKVLIFSKGGSHRAGSSSGDSPCPDGTAETGTASHKRQLFVFNSSSSWAVDICAGQ